MRISDWSSDVCSSDLVVVAFGTQRRLQAADVIFRAAPEADGGGGRLIRKRHQLRGGAQQVQQARFVETLELGLVSNAAIGGLRAAASIVISRPDQFLGLLSGGRRGDGERECAGHRGRSARSEEHTSELQSLMRIP